MADSMTTFKVRPSDHQTLMALLRYLYGGIDEDQFRVVLVTLGYRATQDIKDQVKFLAEQMHLAFK